MVEKAAGGGRRGKEEERMFLGMSIYLTHWISGVDWFGLVGRQDTPCSQSSSFFK